MSGGISWKPSISSAADLAQAMLTLIDRLQTGVDVNWGTYHYCGQGVISWHAFAEKIMELARRYGGIEPAKVIPVSTAQYPTIARRPAYSALDCSRINKHFGISPRPWAKSLEITIRQLLAPRQSP